MAIIKRRALLIGIDDYPDPNKLNGCTNDVDIIKSVLEKNGDGSDNFDIEELKNVKSSKVAMGAIESLFALDLDIAILYFSGHGYVNTTGAEIVFPNDCQNDGYYNGLQMRSIMDVLNQSHAKNKILIFDCCHAGDLGRYRVDIDNSDLKTGVSIITACRGNESAMVRDGSASIFTAAFCMALKGAAADFSGNITIGSVYAYIDRFFSASEQRPVFKTNATEFVPIRHVTPKVAPNAIRQIATLFPKPFDEFRLDPSYEVTNSPDTRVQLVEPYADPDHVKVMDTLQELASIGFVRPVDEKHMFYAAMNNKSCKLTDLGRYYWILVKKNLI